MSELKFACPVCGQHLTASPADSGQEISCPTCFQKLVVPQPRAGDSKLVVNASMAERRKAPVSGDSFRPTLTSRKSRISLSVAGLLIVLAGIVYAIYWRTTHYDRRNQDQSSIASNSNTVARANAAAEPAKDLPWNLDVSAASFTNVPAQGRVRGHPFQTEWSTLQGGTLTLRQGRSRSPELVVALYLGVGRPEDLAGKTIVIRSDLQPAPQIQLRWKDEQQKTQTQKIRGGYALKVAFDNPAKGRITGRIWLSMPDEGLSFVAGEFDAEIRKPQPKKPAKAK